MRDFPRYKLLSLIKEYGAKLYQSKSRCRSFLNDFCGQYKREVFVLSTAVEENVPQELLNFKEKNKLSLQSLIVQLKERLKMNYAFTEYASLWAVESWALALDVISVVGDKSFLLETVKPTTENDELQRSLLFASLIGNFDLISDLIKLGVNLNYTDEKGRTPLIYAIISGNCQVVDELLALGAKTEIKDQTGYTALQWAIMLGEDKIVKLLLAADADIDNLSAAGCTALELAQNYGQQDIYQCLKDFSQ
ncbi:ankyrin repeat domain-containing protein [Halanaerobacter jeridensis]|uniref:ankyrin repeat domain-containing protein n=1 Tax=Halanaerobacter jeridensis TaxID=706427 RepID=UPI00195F0FDD|nr:ankyrin repeat domain-containing protein [Halanaerobacter jeridensis]